MEHELTTRPEDDESTGLWYVTGTCSLRDWAATFGPFDSRDDAVRAAAEAFALHDAAEQAP